MTTDREALVDQLSDWEEELQYVYRNGLPLDSRSLLRLVADCKAALTAQGGEQGDTVSVPSDKDNPVVGHKTLQNGAHIPLRKDEADALIAQVRLSEKQRRAAMPDEKSAINALFNAWIRLKDFGWRDADYCPKDGSFFLALECGSTGIHNAHYQGDQFKGSIWIESNGDLWPSEPVLFKLAATKEGK